MHSFATEVDRKTAADPAAVMAKLEAMNLPEMPKDISRLFTKFTRTEDARKVDPNGTGIGLYYAHHVTQAHHGKMWAESEGIGKGSTFTVELPMKGE